MGLFEDNKQEQIYKYRESIEINTWEDFDEYEYSEDFDEYEYEYSEDYYDYDFNNKNEWFEYYISHGLNKYLILNDISIRIDYIDTFEYIFETFNFNPIFKELYEFNYHYHFEVISELFEDLILKLLKTNVEKNNINLFHNIITNYLIVTMKKI